MPKIVSHPDRRREITYALWSVIYHRGITGVSFQAVADAAEISVGRIQHYFASKRDLVIEGARTLVAMSSERWASATEPDDASANLASLVRQPIPRTEEFRLGSAVWYAYLAAALTDDELGEIVREAVASGFSLAAQLTAELHGDVDARAAGVRLVALGNGLSQAVLIGAISSTEALTLLDRELESVRPR